MTAAVRAGCRMDVGVSTYQALLGQARACEESGFDLIWIRDHANISEISGTPLNLECWTSLSALSRDLSRIRLGTLVVNNCWRNPALLAKMAATLDVVSGGRLILGLGAGFLEREFKEYGYDFPSNADRARALGEALAIMTAMWTQPAATFEGRYYRVFKAVNEPKPVQKGGPPMVIGGQGEQITLRNVARYARGWQTNARVEDFIRLRGVLDGYCREIGRDPSEIESYIGYVPMVVSSEAEGRDRIERLKASRPSAGVVTRGATVGTPEQQAEYLAPFVKAGVTNFITYFVETDRHEDNIRAFGEQVIPLLAQLQP